MIIPIGDRVGESGLNCTDVKSRHYNALKLIAALLVVIAHSSRMYVGDGVVQPAGSSSILCTLSLSIYTFHMPLFIAVSGMIYGYCIDNLGKYEKSFEFIKGKAFRLLIPYLFFGIVCVAPVMVWLNFTEDSYPMYCLKGILLVKDSRHLWYLIVLFEIFVICMFAKRLIQKRNIFVSVGIVVALTVLALFADGLPKALQFHHCCYYLLYFFLGILFNRYYEKVCGILKNPICILLMLCCSIWLFIYRDVVPPIPGALSGCAVTIGLTAYFSEKFMNSTLVKRAVKNGFGIYLFHPVIIYILYSYLGPMDILPAVLFTGITVVAYVISWLMTELLRKLHLGMFIGE